MDEGEESKQTQKKFGIVSTGPQWKAILNDAIGDILGEEGKGRWFAGTECVGVDAGGLHAEGGSVKEKVMGATGRLMGRGDVGVVVLGCAGMVGMEGWVREVAGEGVAVVDGVKAGVGLLQGWLRGGFFGGRGEDKRVGGETEGEMRMQVGATEEVYKAEENERMVEMSKRQRTD
ncbi:MAG: hypothetical protein LQ345_004725 [Seirophora villosa]|nr:MAG: hypothetical protein LQ345_004725 [Seirophora villosa]